MRLAFLGTPDFAVPSLAALIEAGHEIACVYSQPPKPRGRGQALRPSPVQAFAEARGIAVRTPVSMKAPEEIEAFRALNLDAAVVVAFGQILVREVLEAPRFGCFNLHASLLPRWRGAAPIHRAIMAGDHMTGVQVMRMSEGLDEGSVVLSETARIDALDTVETLQERLAEVGARLLVEAMESVAEGTATETPQPRVGVTYARKITPDEARIDWGRSAHDVDRQIRGLSPWPGAWFEVQTERGSVRVKALLSQAGELEGPVGEVLDEQFLIGCGEGSVRILRAQREGKGPQEAAEFLRGFPLTPGTRLA
jgi:methionyl-tRNA formyltransferase